MAIVTDLLSAADDTALRSPGHETPHRIVQIAHVVMDLEAAVRRWVAATRAGPFFRTHFPLDQQHFRGRVHQSAGLDVAVAYHHDMMIELVAPLDDAPNIFGEVLARRGEGLHHLMLSTADFAKDVADYEDRGFAVVAGGHIPGFCRAAFIDTMPTLGYYTELAEVAPSLNRAADVIRSAHADWDGRDPLRPYPTT